MHEHWKQCVDKKHSMHSVMSLEEADSSDINNNNAEIINEGNITIVNE